MNFWISAYKLNKFTMLQEEPTLAIHWIIELGDSERYTRESVQYSLFVSFMEAFLIDSWEEKKNNIHTIISSTQMSLHQGNLF